MSDHTEMNTQKQASPSIERTSPIKPAPGKAIGVKIIGRMTVVHSTYRPVARQRTMREVLNRSLSPFERDYLNWYHGDPLKISFKKAHESRMDNREGINASKHCGCFHCEAIFRPYEISEWFKDNKDSTAICPHCDIDAVIGDASGYPITPHFLRAMHEHWYREV